MRPIGLKLTRSGQNATRVEEGADAEEAPARKGSNRAEKASAKAREIKASSDVGPREGTRHSPTRWLQANCGVEAVTARFAP